MSEPFTDEEIKNMMEFCKPQKVSEDIPPYALKGMLQKAYDDERRFLATIAERDKRIEEMLRIGLKQEDENIALQSQLEELELDNIMLKKTLKLSQGSVGELKGYLATAQSQLEQQDEAIVILHKRISAYNDMEARLERMEEFIVDVIKTFPAGCKLTKDARQALEGEK